MNALRPEVMHVAGYSALGDLLFDALQTHQSETVLVEASRRREAGRWSGRDVRAWALRVTRRLQDLGVEPGDRVAIVMSNQSKWLVTATGALFAGAVLVPIDYKLSAAEQQALVAHAEPAVVVTEFPVWRTWTEVAGTVWVSEAPASAELGTALRWEDLPQDAGQLVARAADDIATVVYSSGTGGAPKGCLLPHRAYLAQLAALLSRVPLAPGDVYFSILPTNHAIDFMVGFVGPFVCGATVVHQRTLRPELLRWTMQHYGVTHMAVVPLILEAFKRGVEEKLDALVGWRRRLADGLVEANARLTERTPRHLLSSRLLRPVHDAFGGRLRLLICGGAYTDRGLAAYFYRLGIPVLIGYGLTEACTCVTVNGLTPWRGDSVGSPLDGVEVRIHEPDEGGVGEVQVSGPTLMLGYLDAPELTAAAFLDGWLRTGDLGWFDASGHLHLVGRRKDMIVTAGGKNIYPEDVAYAFAEVPCEEHAVFARNTLWPRRTMQDEELVLVVRGASSLEVVRAVAACNRVLPDFKRVRGVLVWEEEFPRTASMKLKRAALADQIRADKESADVVRITA